MIGYYVHHHGSGHLRRASALADELGTEVTGLSSLDRPDGWRGEWVRLPADTGPDTAQPIDPTARGTLHWVPRGAAGVRARAAALSAWFESARPSAVVVDVSVEAALLARLHGIPVIVVAQPGDRTDDAHSLVYRIADLVLGFWPAGFDVLTTRELLGDRFAAVGALSRFAIADRRFAIADGRSATAGGGSATADRRSVKSDEPLTIVVFSGTGGAGASALADVVRSARAALPDASWVELSDASAETVESALRRASLVFSHCGQNAVAEIAALRVPAVLVPEQRPFAEQHRLAAALAASSVPVVVVTPNGTEGYARRAADVDWAQLAVQLTSPDRPSLADVVPPADNAGAGWAEWVDGRAGERAAAAVRAVAEAVERA